VTERESVEFRLMSDPAHLGQVRDAVRRAAGEAGFAEADREQIALAVDEALTNVIKHGYGGRHDQPIDVWIEAVTQEERCGIRIVVRDFGKPVDPDSICGRDLDDLRPGGLGVHIIKTVMDDVSYKPDAGGGTRLTMLKWKQR
jgi:anti-sigma regulatory factor (Ser/Thr protein kinase)